MDYRDNFFDILHMCNLVVSFFIPYSCTSKNKVAYTLLKPPLVNGMNTRPCSKTGVH